MKLFRTLFFVAFTCILMQYSVSAQHQRNVLLEEFTSQTCPPCVTVKPIVAAFAKTPNVITVTYHQNYPAPGDVYNVLDNALNRTRHDWYGVQGIPAGYLNGKSTSLGSVAALQSAAAPYLAQQSPLLITITEDRSKSPIEVTVKVKNDGNSAVSGVSLHTQVINYYSDLKDYPDVKNNPNTRYSEFDYCIMKALPSINGAPLSIDAGKEFTATYTYSIGANKSLWTSPYVIAFVQNMNTKEVLQAGSNFGSISNQASIESTESAYMMTGRNKDIKKTVTLKNDKSKAMSVAVSFAGTPAVPSDWTTPMLSQSTVTIPANGTINVDVIFKAGSNGGSFFNTLKVTPQVNNEINIESYYSFGYLAENTKYAVLAGYSNNGLVDSYTNLNNIAKYKNEVAYVPAMKTVFDQLGTVNFDAVVVPIDFANRGAFVNNDFSSIVSDLFNNGTKMLFYGDAAFSNAFGASLPAGWRNFFTSIGVTGVQPNPTLRVNSSTGVPVAYTIRGTANDELGKGLTLAMNGSQTMFNYYTESLNINTQKNKATQFLYYDNTTASIAGVRLESGNSKAVILGFPLEAISSGAARTALTSKIMDWLTTAGVPTADIAVLGDKGQEIDVVEFGDVGLNQTVTKTFDIKNTGKADLVISGFEWDDSMPGWFKLGGNVTFPLTVAAGSTKTMNIECTAKELDDQISFCTIKSNATSGDKSVGLILRGVKVSSVELGTSGNGMLSVSAGPNPFTESTKVNYTVGGETPQVVTVSVVDALGNTVATLANSIMGPGTYNASLNGATLAAGAYRVVVTSGVTSTYVPVMLVK